MYASSIETVIIFAHKKRCKRGNQKL